MRAGQLIRTPIMLAAGLSLGLGLRVMRLNL
jgi:hypothetical protein